MRTFFALILLIPLSSVVSKSVTPIALPNANPKVDVALLSTSGWIRDPRHHYYQRHRPKHGPLPDPVQISSSIRINQADAHRYLPRQKRDTAGKDVNKRQIVIQDASQALGAQTFLGSPVGGSGIQNGQQVFFAQQHPQQYTIQQGTNGLFYATPAPMQFQAVTTLPVVTPQNQLFVLQPNGNTYTPQTPQTKTKPPASKFVARTGETEQEEIADQIQEESIVIPTRVSLQPKVSIVSHADPNSQQDPGKREPQKTQQQIQYEEAQQVLQNIIKQQALQQTQQQRQQHFQLQQQALVQQQLQEQFQQAHLQQLREQLQEQQQQEKIQQQQTTHAQTQQQATHPQLQQATHPQLQQATNPHTQQHATNPHTQQQAAHAQVQRQQQFSNAQIQANLETHNIAFQHSPPTAAVPQEQQVHQSGGHHFVQQQQQQHQQQLPNQRIFQGGNVQPHIAHRNPHTETPEARPAPANSAPQNAGNFEIRHQTYVSGPGGQKFTVPVPVPMQQQSEKVQNSREVNSREAEEAENERRREDRGSDERDRRREGSEEKEPEERKRRPHRPMSSFMRRIMDAFSVRGGASERVGTNIALPVLATTGVFFGLGALAAGWYLSNSNREVGILRRTGKPVPPGTPNVKRIRRHAAGTQSEVDQATFFQTIIQQAIEKQQGQYEGGDESEANFDSHTQDNPQRHQVTKFGTSKRKPVNRNDFLGDEHALDKTSPNSKVYQGPHNDDHHHHKSPGLFSRQALNFAKVAIPAIIISGAVIAIGFVIVGWYFTGSNREIAFLEPSAYSRRLKRDLTTTALSDGWVQKVLTSIHENPYEGKRQNQGLGGGFVPFPELEASKHNLEYHANISDAVVAVSLGVVAFFSLMGIVFAWLAAQNEKNNLGLEGSYGFGGWPGSYRKRSGAARFGPINSNPRHFLEQNATFLESILAKFETAQKRIPTLRDAAVKKPQ